MLEVSELMYAQMPPALDASTMQAGQEMSLQLAASEWLGPLAPIALSPFFGLALLSGIATYGPEWLQERSALFQADGALSSPLLFWTMALLATLTSLPRLTKVSKPLGLAADKLEAYSAVIILMVVRMFGSQFQADAAVDPTSPDPLMLSAGVGAVSLNVMLSAFAALNVIVINMVKLFCEFLIWLLPIPLIDAAVESVNKSVCAGMMALYCYNPWLATILNLTLLLVCLLIFAWIYRRLVYYQELIAGPALAWLIPSWFGQKGAEFLAFIDSDPHRSPRYSRVRVSRDDQGAYHVTGRRWWKQFQWQLIRSASSSKQAGWFSQQLKMEDQQNRPYLLTHRNWIAGDALYNQPEPLKSVKAAGA